MLIELCIHWSASLVGATTSLETFRNVVVSLGGGGGIMSQASIALSGMCVRLARKVESRSVTQQRQKKRLFQTSTDATTLRMVAKRTK